MKKILVTSTVAFLAFSFVACNKDAEEFITDNYVNYTIPEGGHSSVSGISITDKTEFEFTAIFDQTCQYSTGLPENQADINKLYGISDCGSNHHENSARFGWRWYDEQLQIFAYCYRNGQREEQFITAVEPDKEYSYNLKVEPENYIFTLNGISVSMIRGCNLESSRYRLYPYFGGDEVAPHPIHIKIKEHRFN